MKIAKKAFRVTPHWYNGECGPVNHPTYADTAAKAKYEAAMNGDELDNDWWKDRAIRWPEMDLIEQEPLHAVSLLSDSQLRKMAHAYGLESSNPGYRNYYHSGLDSDWEALRLLMLAIRDDCGPNLSAKYYYHLTDLGIKVILSTKPVLRCSLTKSGRGNEGS